MNDGILTTGQVARICGFAPRTVNKLFDQGHEHFRGFVIPGGKDRRFSVAALEGYLATRPDADACRRRLAAELTRGKHWRQPKAEIGSPAAS